MVTIVTRGDRICKEHYAKERLYKWLLVLHIVAKFNNIFKFIERKDFVGSRWLLILYKCMITPKFISNTVRIERYVQVLLLYIEEDYINDYHCISISSCTE